MSRTALLASAAIGLTAIQPFPAHAEMLETMPKGHYQCALPGDAAGEAWLPVEGADFRIINASSYKAPDGTRGSYLLIGKTFVFTNGPYSNMRFERAGDNLLRKVEPDGKPGRILCARSAR